MTDMRSIKSSEEPSVTEPIQTPPSSPPPSNNPPSEVKPVAPNNPPPQGGNEPPLYAAETGFSLFMKLFIVPAIIVGVALGIFLLGTIALQHPKTASQYLHELKSDSTEKRWQAA